MQQPDATWDRIKQFFTAVSALPPEARHAALLEAGATDHERHEVMALLAAHPLTEAPASAPAAAATIATAEGPDTLIGPYKLLEQIGEGGFGTVHAAEQQAPIRRRVALKIVKPGMDSKQVLARFEQERQALALMDHPNIARVFDGGSTPNGRPFFVMELVKGAPITEYCDRERLTAVDRLHLFVDVVRAVQHAHQKGVIHRDLKPSNVLVTVVDGKPIPKVIDFGVAKATQGRLTEHTLFTEHKQMIGTPLYMSPEQAQLSGVDVDTRSDVYSLGVMLYELLTGTTPFRKEELETAGMLEMFRMLREVEPPRPSTRVATLGATTSAIAAQRRVEPRRLGGMLRGDLDWIVMKCLEKERGRRYETANDLARDVERHLAGEAVLAAPPAIAYRLRKFVRRYRVQVAAAALVFVVLAIGLWQAQAAATSNARALATERRSTAKEFFNQARLHADLGDWSSALSQLDKAQEHDHDPVAIALARVNAWEATGERDLVEDELARLQRRNDLGPSQDLVQLLWRDPSRPRPDGAAAIEWRSALRDLENSPHLNEAWRGYARAMGAATLPTAVEQLEALLHIDPKHRRAAEVRLWLVLLLRGPEAGLQASERFRLFWPQDDYGKIAEAACLSMTGEDKAAERLAATLQKASSREFYRLLTTWSRDLHALLDGARAKRFHATLGARFSRAMLQSTSLVGDLMGSDAMNRSIRLHPSFTQLGDLLRESVGAIGMKDTSASAFDTLIELTDLPSLRVVKAIAQCNSGAEIEGLHALCLACEGPADFFMSRRAIHDFLVLEAGVVAGRLVRLRPAINSELKNDLLAIAPKLTANLRDTNTKSLECLTELMSVVGGKWRTLECVAHLMARDDIDLDGQLIAVASCIRSGSGDQAEEILKPILAAHPEHAHARELERRLATLRLEQAAAKQPEPR
jgi:serine/threonine protein kinase